MVSGKIYYTRLSVIRDPIPYLELVIGAVLKVNNHALEFDRSALHTELKCPVAISIVDEDPIVVHFAVHVYASKLLPSALFFVVPLSPGNCTETQYQRHNTTYAYPTVETHALSP